ncbi:MAG: hypothetical protein K0R14_1114 [Burkholderiales bacterium]|jgi:uncharacterized protein YycO|nr:hypothetical protein [Burkholderiales bacterium]
MNKIRNLFFIFTFIIISYNSLANSKQITLKSGDLLFQDLNCGAFCDGVDEVTYGINNTYISHVGMVIVDSKGQVKVIEANSQGVVLTPLPKFLGYSHDSSGKPMVIVERLKPEYQYLIPKAIEYAKLQLGKPYNKTFVPNNRISYYCSQLIYAAFLSANHGQSIFHTHKMSFKDPKTGKTSLIWQNYFDQLKANTPEGLIGTNPGMMSREASLEVVYKYGKLRQRSNFKKSGYDEAIDKTHTVDVVKQAENFINRYGKDKAVDEFKKGLKPIFMIDFKGNVILSPIHPDTIGTNQINFKDSSGVFAVQEEIKKAKSGGGWLKGRYRKNHITGDYECRKLYVLPMDKSYFIGSWYYYPANGKR